MSFNFRTSSDIGAAKYEGVRLLPNTPRNPNDFHSMQDILRYRMAMLLDELYGNCRVAIGHGDPFVVSTTKVKVDGVWYLDGYRIEIEDLESTIDFPVDQSFNIWLDITFVTIDLKEDSSIALQDTGSDKFIPTSERFKFEYAIRTELVTLSELLPDTVDATYHIGVATVGEPITFEDAPTIAVIDLTYSNAIEIVSNAVSVDDDGWVYIEKMSTGKAEAHAFVESDDNGDFLKMGMKDGDGEIIALIQALNLGKWFPTFTLKREDQLVTISPDGVIVDEGTGNAVSLSPDSIRLSSSAAQQFTVNENKLGYKQPMTGDPGFEAVLLAEAVTELYNAVLEVEGDYSTPTAFYQKALFIHSQPVDPEIGIPIYRTHYHRDDYPKDGIIDINHLIKVPQGQSSTGTVKLDILFFDSMTSLEPDAADYSIIKTYTWPVDQASFLTEVKLKFHPHPGEIIGTGGGGQTGNGGENPIGEGEDPWYAHFRFEYSIISDDVIDGTVEWLSSQNLKHNDYTNPFVLTGVDYLRIGNYFLFMDSDGDLRVKTMSNIYDGSIIQAIVLPAGEDPSALGGMKVGGGVRELSGGASAVHIRGIVKILTGVSSGLSGPFAYTDEENNAIKIMFPAIDQTISADFGLVSREGWDGIMSAIIQGGSGIQSLNNKTDPNQNLDVSVVSGMSGLPYWTYDGGFSRHILKFPRADSGGPGTFGLMTYNQNQGLLSALHNHPKDVKFVAESWIDPVTGGSLAPSGAFYTSIQSAIDDFVSEGDVGTIMVFPGTYDGFILADQINVIAYDIPTTICTGPIYDRNLSDGNHNVNGVTCEVAITLDTTSISANLTALYVDRAGTILTTRGTITSKAIGSTSDASQPPPTVDIRAGKWVHHGDVGRRDNSFSCTGGGVDVHGTNGSAFVEIYGNIYISQHLNYGSWPDNLVCGLDVATKGGNIANVLMVGDIWCYQGCFALLKTGSTLGYIDFRGNLSLITGTEGRCVDVSGPMRLADGRYVNDANTDAPILFRAATTLRLKNIELQAKSGAIEGIDANGSGTNKYTVAMPVYSDEPIDSALDATLSGDYNAI